MSNIAIMMDYETRAKTRDAVVRSLGAVAFDMFDPSVEFEAFYRNIKDEQEDQPHRRIDPETDAWWREQGDDARRVFDNPEDPKIDIRRAHMEFHAFAKQSGATYVWSNGLLFDMVIYQDICDMYWLTPFYEFRGPRDTRTLWSAAGVKNYARPNWPTKHNALHDACNQAMTVIEAHQKLGVTKYV